jgi:hypothetical protein
MVNLSSRSLVRYGILPESLEYCGRLSYSQCTLIRPGEMFCELKDGSRNEIGEKVSRFACRYLPYKLQAASL